MALATKYNTKWSEMIVLKATHDWPKGAIVPPAIKKWTLFSLDVDDAIWNDNSIIDPDDWDGNVPNWLTHEEVHVAIWAHLNILGCEEDLQWSKTECSVMVCFYTKEHKAVSKAMQDATGKP